MAHLWTAGLFLICFVHHAFAIDEKFEFVIGKSPIKLRPGKQHTSSIVWKRDGDLVAELDSGGGLDYYGTFKNRTTLDITTGELTIEPTQALDAGRYVTEIDNILQEDGYQVVAVEEVPKPSVWVKPGKDENEYPVVCDGVVDKAGRVTFWWDISGRDPREWIELGRNITLEKNDTTKRVEFLYCKIGNVGGEKESEPYINPFYESEKHLERPSNLAKKKNSINQMEVEVEVEDPWMSLSYVPGTFSLLLFNSLERRLNWTHWRRIYNF
ncbi:hypothetical protein WMY93_018023 [Mugilogobius chulae]|uniref:Uncharacterized protein n=1 Tax=Mugilogobius chulae TaxID=88201 RepID=A0AAW0NUZ4_9GOBI